MPFPSFFALLQYWRAFATAAMHALSLPTWVIHISSVLEWLLAIAYLWRLGEQGDRRWFGLALAMLPALISALCACTWHYYDNAPQLEWLVTLQAGTTLLGNCALMLAAYWLWRPASQPDRAIDSNE